MLYLFLSSLLIIPISTVIYTICCFKHFDYKKYKIYEKETIRPYLKLDSRGETLRMLGKKEKCIADYYEAEKNIKYP